MLGHEYRMRLVWRPDASGRYLTTTCPIQTDVAVAAMSPMRPDIELEVTGR